MSSCPCCAEPSDASSDHAPTEDDGSAPRRPDDGTRAIAARRAPRRSTRASVAERGRCRVLTLGHSTRPLDEFLDLLRAHGVSQLVDVRTVPHSRRNPQYDTVALRRSVEAAGIGYVHAPGLGGFRKTTPDSPNTGWRNLSFRGYADYMQTPEFDAELTALIELARTDRVAIMCAEAVPWRCHRSLIADALGVHGVPACEIASATRLQPHELTPFARVEHGCITYPPESADVSA